MFKWKSGCIYMKQNICPSFSLHSKLLSPLADQAGVDNVAATDHDDDGARGRPPLLQHLAQQPRVHRGQHGATGNLHQHPMVISKPESWDMASNMHHYYSIDMMVTMTLSDINWNILHCIKSPDASSFRLFVRYFQGYHTIRLHTLFSNYLCDTSLIRWSPSLSSAPAACQPPWGPRGWWPRWWSPPDSRWRPLSGPETWTGAQFFFHSHLTRTLPLLDSLPRMSPWPPGARVSRPRRCPAPGGGPGPGPRPPRRWPDSRGPWPRPAEPSPRSRGCCDPPRCSPDIRAGLHSLHWSAVTHLTEGVDHEGPLPGPHSLLGSSVGLVPVVPCHRHFHLFSLHE